LLDLNVQIFVQKFILETGEIGIMSKLILSYCPFSTYLKSVWVRNENTTKKRA